MRRFLKPTIVPLAALALTITGLVRPVDAANGLVSLSHLAAEAGYSYTWIASESAVALTRPGLYVLVRTGNPLYDVNESIESTAQAPQFRDNDIFIGSALVKRLRALAIKYAPPAQHPNMVGGHSDVDLPAAHGALTVAVAPTQLSDAVVVSGSGPSNAPLTITLSADIARDMPRVLLSRTSIETNAAGTYAVEISTAPLHLQKSMILVSATSLPGISEAHTSFVLGQPSPAIAHPIDETPRDFRPHL